METTSKLQTISIGLIAITFLCVNQVATSENKTSEIIVPNFTLNTGKKIPSIGYGTWQAKDEELEKALEAALETGYRHIDTAYVYDNEKVIGRVLKKWISQGKLKREDLFLVTKLPNFGNRPESVNKYMQRSLKNLQVDYVDLYLVHAPFALKEVEGNPHPKTPEGNIDLDTTTDHIAIWKEMEKLVDAGYTKAIGLSNFNKTQVERILKNCKIQPSSLQIELHVYLQHNILVDFCKKNNILVTAYSPLGAPGLATFNAKFGKTEPLPTVLGNPIVKEIAKKHGKTEAQVVLRFDIQRGIIPIPKSTNPGRLRQNLDIFDFELDSEDLQKLKSLDAGIRLLDFKIFKGVEKHPEYPFRSDIQE